MRALIIGGAGFVGTYLIKFLRDECQAEVLVTKMPHENIIEDGVKVLDLDILQKDAVTEMFKSERPDWIFHLAAQSSVSISWKNPALTIDVNVKGASNVLEALRESQINARILLIGSGEEYGHILPQESPILEDNNTRPGNIYAATKVCQNMLGRIYADAYGLDVMMVRAFNHIGPNQTPIFVVADFCKQVAEIEAGQREPVMHVGNLSAKRDFTDVRDVIRAYIRLMEKGKAGETYNVGSGKAIEIQQILDMILSHAKRKIEVRPDPARFRPVDVPMIEADITKIVECTGWKPVIPLEQTVRETLDYWRRETGALPN